MTWHALLALSMLDPQEHEVLARTLGEVRRARQRRAACKLAAIPLLVVLGAGGLATHRRPSETIPAPVAEKPPGAAASSRQSLAVVEWKGGMPSLVEYSGEDLGKLELCFSLEPVVAFPDEIW